MADYYPPVNFHFRVTGLGEGIDVEFREVSGLSVQIQTEALKEGGLNTHEHTIPVRVTYSPVTLKRGLVTSAARSELLRWLKNGIENFEFEGKNLTIVLLNEQHDPLVSWNLVHALPKSWKFSDLNAERGEILIESIELSYDYFTYNA